MGFRGRDGGRTSRSSGDISKEGLDLIDGSGYKELILQGKKRGKKDTVQRGKLRDREDENII